MTDPRDRILEYALQVHFRGKVVRDLAPEVRRAWERGVRGSDLDDLELVDPSFDDLEELERGLPRRRPRLLPWIVASVAAAALLLFAWARFAGETRPEERDTTVAEMEGGEPVPVDTTRPQDAGERESGVEESPPDLELDGGETPDEGVHELPSQREPISEADLVQLAASAHDVYRSMVWADISTPAGLPPLEKLRRDSREACMKLAEMLTSEPRLWDEAESWVREPFEEKYERDGPPEDQVQGVVLDLLALEGSAQAIRLAEELWPRAPAAFHVEHIVAFAEAGAWIFQRELSAMIDERDAFKERALLLPAVYLATR
jgi:hypothetical protein